MLHWHPFPAFYQEFLNLGGHILFRTLLLNHPANVITCATLLAILFTKNKFWKFLKCHRTCPSKSEPLLQIELVNKIRSIVE